MLLGSLRQSAVLSLLKNKVFAKELVRPIGSWGAALKTSYKQGTSLAATADRYKDNTNAQYMYMKAMNRTNPDATIKHYESGKYNVSSNDCKAEYLQALALTDKLPNKNVGNAIRNYSDEKVFSDVYGHLEDEINSFDNNNHGIGTSNETTNATKNTITKEKISQKINQRQGLSKRTDGTSFGKRIEVEEKNEGKGLSSYNPFVKRTPIPVEIYQSTSGQFVKTIKWFFMTMVMFSLITSVLEDRGLGGALGSYKKIEPEKVTTRVSFNDVRGCDEAKDELVEIVEFLRNPAKFTRLGGKLPKGVLLTGEPGTGKTLLARAVACEANVPFFYCNGSEFDEMFIGVGARRMRDLFDAAREHKPCIVFIDEVDSVGGHRSEKDQSYAKMTLNQLLVEMDGFEQNEGIVIIGATNFPQTLDKALIRPGRFDKHVAVPLPDRQGRLEILQIYARNVSMDPTYQLDLLARGTPGFTGADLSNLINQAALYASLKNATFVSQEHLEYAKDKILMGAERRSAVVSEENRKLVAFHESGHALMTLLCEGTMPLHKITIMPRGHSLGMVSQLPEDDNLNSTKKQLMARLFVCMGGRAAEQLKFGLNEVTSGASDDIDKATRLAYQMVTRFGMSEAVGKIVVSNDERMKLSPTMLNLIESEVKKLCQDAFNHAISVLKANEDLLNKLANTLLEKETMAAPEVIELLGNLPKVKFSS